ncbi:MAG: DUF4956 domain-containing protein [Clostridiales bacterium]|nr:DUF4956 domain-containing protein [Clostridiales bacterium]MBP3940601.1 hypothetical protein [Christensenellaceae bacterium]MBR2223297.1 hypothetical protein [Christensenellaceae bacterium]MBR3842769.1 hypothetical protein [Christensenellaceae bacterium]
MAEILQAFALSDQITLMMVIATLLVSFVLGIFIYFIYKRSYLGVLFQKSYGVALIMITMVSSVLIMVLSSNITLSLGTIGSLAIVRFRTAVKDPMDTVFMFWALAAGVITGAQLYTVAIIASVVLGIFMIILSMVRSRSNMPYIMVLKFQDEAKADVQEILRRFPQGKLKNKTVSRGVIEMTIEMSVGDKEIALMDRFADIPGVYDAALISYTGDIVA